MYNNTSSGDFYSGSNRTYGSKKRKLSKRAGAFADRMGFKRFRGPTISVKKIDRLVGKSLKSRNITEPEQKYLETVSTGTSISATENLVLLNAMFLGTTDNQKIGNKIRVTKLEINAIVALSPTAAGGRDFGKVSLFIDKQADGQAPGFSSAIGSNSQTPYTNNGGNILIKNANLEHMFYIIKDWDYVLDSTAGVSGTWQQNVCRMKAEIPINRVVQYNNADTGTITEIMTNSFYLGFLGSQTAGATESIIAYFVRLWYTDM